MGIINDSFMISNKVGQKLYDDFAKDIFKNGGMDKNKICICCSKCTHIMRCPGGTPGCVIRDKDVYMPIYKKQCMNG